MEQQVQHRHILCPSSDLQMDPNKQVVDQKGEIRRRQAEPQSPPERLFAHFRVVKYSDFDEAHHLVGASQRQGLAAASDQNKGLREGG